MRLSDFNFDLPAELIAQKPLPRRDDSRMMILERTRGRISHARFRDFPGHVERGDVLVINDSRVIPARVWGSKDGAEVEFLLLREIGQGAWETLARPARRLRPGDVIVFSESLRAEVASILPDGRRILLFRGDVRAELRRIGYAPLPPYIRRKKREAGLRDFDLERYQTVFAARDGSIAAPTAGLHFTPEVLDRIRSRGAVVVPVTLEVGLATFQPVRVELVEDHEMLEERYSISPEAAAAVNAARARSRPVTAVGTTSVRTLESAFREGRLQPGSGSTRLFITPGYEFRTVDRLLTNFHPPKSTLLMLVAAFAGLDFIRQAYREAVRSRYRFFSYGDCMLII